MRAIKFLWLLSTLLGLSTQVEAASSDKNNIKKCLSLVKKTCGNKDYKTCMSAQTKKSAQVSECLSFLVTQNKKTKINTNGLGNSIKELISSSVMSKDQKKCFEISKVVCAEGEDLTLCMKKRAGKFPSFCREAAIQGIDSLKGVYRSDRKAAMCADILVAKCDLALPEAKIKPNPKLYQAALDKYQSCVQARVLQEKECKDVIDPKKNDGATQLIK